MHRLHHLRFTDTDIADESLYLEVWPFVPLAKDLKDLLKPVGGHWSLIWDKTHHWGDFFFLVHFQPLTNSKAVQGTLNCSPIGQWLAVDQREGVM